MPTLAIFVQTSVPWRQDRVILHVCQLTHLNKKFTLQIGWLMEKLHVHVLTPYEYVVMKPKLDHVVQTCTEIPFSGTNCVHVM